ncbi:MAG: hypothetical protein A2W22_04605 [Candidatus Levybacteria bacterium RBG_16_35_11]|nr:MAG: hypothetical protein A2W22_04605 [Candidatus Levybacteria bacterium RBG_16_35_11]
MYAQKIRVMIMENETKDERIQRLVKEGIEKAKQEERIQRLVKDGIEREKQKDAKIIENVIVEAKVKDEFETKKRTALAKLSWIYIIITSFFISVLTAFAGLFIFSTIDALAISGVVFVIMIFLSANNRKSVMKTYENPETLRTAEVKRKKQWVWTAILIVIAVLFFVILPVIMNDNNIPVYQQTSDYYLDYTTPKPTQSVQQTANQIAYTTLYPTYNTGDIVKDSDDGNLYEIELINDNNYTSFILHSSVFSETNGENNYLTDITWFYACTTTICNNWKAMTDYQLIAIFQNLKNNKITFGERRNGYLELTRDYTKNGTKYKEYMSLIAGQHKPFIEESYDDTETDEQPREIDIGKVAIIIFVLGIIGYGYVILKRRKQNVKN